jgi:hypothetical protein
VASGGRTKPQVVVGGLRELGVASRGHKWPFWVGGSLGGSYVTMGSHRWLQKLSLGVHGWRRRSLMVLWGLWCLRGLQVAIGGRG